MCLYTHTHLNTKFTLERTLPYLECPFVAQMKTRHIQDLISLTAIEHVSGSRHSHSLRERSKVTMLGMAPQQTSFGV